MKLPDKAYEAVLQNDYKISFYKSEASVDESILTLPKWMVELIKDVETESFNRGKDSVIQPIRNALRL